MNRYAVIVDQMVENIVAWDGESPWSIPANAILLPIATDERCAPSWTYDANASPRFFEPTPQPSSRTWTAYQFLQRFTAAERATMRSLAQTDENVADFLQLLQAAQEVVSDDPMTVAGMDYAVSVGIVTAERKTEILS